MEKRINVDHSVARKTIYEKKQENADHTASRKEIYLHKSDKEQKNNEEYDYE